MVRLSDRRFHHRVHQTRVSTLRDVQQILDFLVYFGILGIIAWKIAFMQF